MLDDLETVPWPTLEHAYGSAAATPGCIRKLASPDAQVRGRAMDTLRASIFHQGTVYEATVPATRFLAELLEDPAAPDRAQILGLLADLVGSEHQEWLPGTYPVAEYRAKSVPGAGILAAAPPLAEDDDGSAEARYDYLDSLGRAHGEALYAHVQLGIYDAVRAAVPLLCRLARDSDPGLCVLAAFLLGWFPENAAESLGPLTAAAADPRDAVAATALVAAGLIGRPGTPADTAAERALTAREASGQGQDIVRWAAATALAQMRGRAAGQDVADELRAWSAGDRRPHPEIPYHHGHLAAYASVTLRYLDSCDEAALNELTARIPRAAGAGAMIVTGEALRRAFPGGAVPAGTPYSALTAPQRRLVETLASSPGVWEHQGRTFMNFSILMRSYGLPRSHAAMRDYTSA